MFIIMIFLSNVDFNLQLEFREQFFATGAKIDQNLRKIGKFGLRMLFFLQKF